MSQWRRFFKGWAPREGGKRGVYPGSWELEGPLFINLAEPVAAAFVGARVLRAVALRGGTQVMPSALEKLEELLQRALPKDVTAHLAAEAEAILEWIEARPSQTVEDERGAARSELEMMVGSDLESRLSVARFALAEGYDLELEYFDPESKTWTRTRAVLEGIEGDDEAGLEWALTLWDRGEEWSLSLKYVRWLMPVHLSDFEKRAPSPGAQVLPFPGLSDDDDPD